MTKEEYIDDIEKILKIKLTNYRLTSNDVAYLFNMVYEDIAISCNLDFIRQAVVIDKNTEVYDLNALYTPVGNEIPMRVMSAMDEDENNVSSYLQEIDTNVFKVYKYIYEESNQLFLDYYDGKTIYFVREVIPDIETLSDEIQRLIFSAVIEGIIFNSQDAIPNPISSQAPMSETNLHYQRFFNAKKNIINKMPQRIS